MLESMPQTLLTNSSSWLDWPSSRGRFHNVSLDLASLTSYQPMVDFSDHSDHFHIFEQLIFLSDPPTSKGGFRKPSPDLASLSFYQPMVHFSGHSNYLLRTSSHECHIRAYPLFLPSNAFFGTASQAIQCTFSVTHSTPMFCQH